MEEDTNSTSDSLESILEKARALMLKGVGDEACRFLEEATGRAVSNGAHDHASIYANIRGSYLVALGHDDEALKAFLEAEDFSQAEKSYFQLTTARHLLSALNQPKLALEKVNAVEGTCLEDPAVHQQARAIRGLAFLELDQPEAAVEELEALCDEFSAELPTLSIDLTLVEELLRRRIRSHVSQRYLELVESKAVASEESSVLQKVSELKGLLR